MTGKGTVQNTGIVWLTDYDLDNQKYTAARPKIHKFGENKFLLMYEEWETEINKEGLVTSLDKYQTTKAMIIDEYGHVLKDKVDMGQLRLRSRDKLFDMDGKAAWLELDFDTEVI